MNILLIGPRGVGKSTLIHRVLAEIKVPIYGFETLKDIEQWDDKRGNPLFIYEYGRVRIQTEENLIGYCKEQRPLAFPRAFDRFALQVEVPKGCRVIVMDELGFMESEAPDFKKLVIKLLDGDIPVIAAVKDKSSEFLDAVKAHPNSRHFYITAENRDKLFFEVLSFLKEQLK